LLKLFRINVDVIRAYRGSNPTWHWSYWAGHSERGCTRRGWQHVKYCAASASHPSGGTVRSWQQWRPAVCWPRPWCSQQTPQQYV